MRKKSSMARNFLRACCVMGGVVLYSSLGAQDYVFSALNPAVEDPAGRNGQMTLRKFLSEFEEQYAMRFVCKSQLLRMEISAHEGKQFRSQADAEEYLFDRLRNYRFSVKKVADRQYAISRRAPRITSISGGLSACASRTPPNDLNMSEIRQGTINGRSKEGRVGTEWVSTGRSRWSTCN